ncbi:hypothetical protein SAMN05421636_101449 [Pricia antarctica]|uniref:ATP synthase protein I n=1 Tax=Pricia antarctica TaxID=641691 RepID=A0A1G6WWH3_9FLAO|nr:DUF6168 family protein [Pricia antarctica]SDD70154.1 hypothetical protein SAMN05421636_101449 [Pricia antarctica]
MPKLNPITLFLLILVTLLGASFFFHTIILQNYSLPKYGDKIVLSYIINFLVASIIYMGLYRFRNKLKTQIGFVFMGGSFLKFILFFILFYPSYKTDGEMDSSEFAAFFVPYAICLVVETLFTAKMLQKME